MKHFLEGMLGLVLYLVFEALAEEGIEILFRAILEYPFERLAAAGPVFLEYGWRFASAWHLAVGSLTGFVGAYLHPDRLIHNPLIPGSSVLTVPILVGLVMRCSGLCDADKRSPIYTFWGGWSFAFGFTVVRFLTIR